jgi:hypothetical protein
MQVYMTFYKFVVEPYYNETNGEVCIEMLFFPVQVSFLFHNACGIRMNS